MQLLERLLRLLQHPELLVNEAEVVDRLDAVRFNSNRFEVQLLRPLQLALDVQAVALVY